MTDRREFVGAMLAIFCGVALPPPLRDAIEVIRTGPAGEWIRSSNGVFWTRNPRNTTLDQAVKNTEVFCLRPLAPIPRGARQPVMEGATHFSVPFASDFTPKL